MRASRVGCLSAAVLAALCGAADASGGTPPSDLWQANLFVQESFPRQTRTNRQIGEINAAFGTGFEDWDDVHNLSLGLQLFRRVAPRWFLGLELDYSRGGVAGEATVETPAGPARLEFEQRYSVYVDLMAVAHFQPCPGCRRAEPFLLAGAGAGYERDRTLLTLRNEWLDERLRVDNDGSFPVFTVGAGLDVPLRPRRDWFLEVGAAYFWGRLEHAVPARGSLAPAPEVIADTDSTGPNYWLGLCWRSGAARPGTPP
jgi:hypothetical protein